MGTSGSEHAPGCTGAWCSVPVGSGTEPHQPSEMKDKLKSPSSHHLLFSFQCFPSELCLECLSFARNEYHLRREKKIQNAEKNPMAMADLCNLKASFLTAKLLQLRQAALVPLAGDHIVLFLINSKPRGESPGRYQSAPSPLSPATLSHLLSPSVHG